MVSFCRIAAIGSLQNGTQFPGNATTPSVAQEKAQGLQPLGWYVCAINKSITKVYAFRRCRQP
jgi:hypothetical protein